MARRVRSGGPERLVLGLVVAPVLKWIFGDLGTRQARAGGALELLDPLLDVVQVEGREIRSVSSLSLLGLVFFMLVMIGAFAVRSAAGFGAVLIAMPMLAFVLPVSTAVSVTTALTAITSIHHVSRDWRRVAWRHFAIMAFYSAIGIGLGFYFIKMLDEHALRRSLGVFLILYSIYALATAKASRMVSARWRGALAAGTGMAGGLSAHCSEPVWDPYTSFISTPYGWRGKFFG